MYTSEPKWLDQQHGVVYYWWEMKILYLVFVVMSLVSTALRRKCCTVYITGGDDGRTDRRSVGGGYSDVAPRRVPPCYRVKCHCHSVSSAHSTHLISSHQPAIRKETRKSSHKMGRTSTSHLVTCPKSCHHWMVKQRLINVRVTI